MQYQVIVIFGKGVEFDYRIDRQDLAGRSADEARKWFDREFTALECEVATPTGKVLIIDRILCVEATRVQTVFGEPIRGRAVRPPHRAHPRRDRFGRRRDLHHRVTD